MQGSPSKRVANWAMTGAPRRSPTSSQELNSMNHALFERASLLAFCWSNFRCSCASLLSRSWPIAVTSSRWMLFYTMYRCLSCVCFSSFFPSVKVHGFRDQAKLMNPEATHTNHIWFGGVSILFPVWLQLPSKNGQVCPTS